jgi:MIP family channel proteins
MEDSLRHAAAEFVGTFALVFVSSGVLLLASSGQPVSLIEIALAQGLIYGVMVTATMRISGHLNPAVTMGFLATRRIAPLMALVYIAAQLLGEMAAAYALSAIYPESIFLSARGGGTIVASGVTTTHAYVVEAIATFILTFVVFGTAVDRKAPRVGGMAIGFTLAALVITTAPLTGASLNPARSFGPALASGMWEGQFIFWLGPMLGAIAAAALYEWLFIRRDREPVDHGQLQGV